MTILILYLSLLVSQANAAVDVAAPDYPRTHISEAGVVVVHMPQIESWDDYKTLTAWAAVEAQLSGEDTRWFGSLKFSGQTDIDFDERVVVVHDIEVVDSRIIGEQPPEAVVALARESISLKPRSVPLDVILRGLPEDFEPPRYRPGPDPELKLDAPRILVATEPARLMIIDGEPVKAPIKDTDLAFVVNTHWDLFWDERKERWYVLNGTAWQTTRSLEEPWKTTKRLPKDLKSLPDDPNWEAVREALPAQKPKQDPPRLLVSLEPAELILIDGDPVVEPIIEAGVSWVSNTESDLFLYQGEYFYLVAGRWFQAAGLDQAWSPVDSLPENFSHIPPEHERGHVLAAVQGTPDARAAAIEARIPRSATIRTDQVPDIQVTYAGEPRFVAIEGTELMRAVNTNHQVIQLGDAYYLCYNAVWFVGTEPAGPWTVATQVPAAIYSIPASDPAHNVTYVYATPSTSRTTVTYAYTPGYFGTYFWAGAVVYGTGYYYAPYYYYYPWGYPAYWWYPRSYGYGSWYNPATGTFGRVGTVYGPYGGAAGGALYNPRTGTYARGWSAWDGDELARSGRAYNPRTGTWGGGNLYYDFDDNEGWSERFVQRGDRWVYSETDYRGDRAYTEFETARGITGSSTRVRDGDAITGTGTARLGDREAATSSRVDREGAELTVTGEDGRSLTASRERGERGTDFEVSGPEGRSATGTTTLGREGRRTDLETSSGGQATSLRTDQGRTTVGRTESGDLYAARNGDVYRRGDDGWNRYENGQWRSSQRASAGLNRQSNARRTGTYRHNQFRSARGGGLSGRRPGGRRR